MKVFLLGAAFGAKNVVDIDDVTIENANEQAGIDLRDGDIMRSPHASSLRSTLNDEYYRWDLPIPVELSSAMNLKARGEYLEAMVEYELRTCVSFKPWEGEDDFISIYPLGGCWSYVGHVYPSQQNVSIGNGCEWSVTIEHELMHALGIYHEQSRPDRDDYIFLDLEQVEAGKEHNFNKYDLEFVSPVDTPYAYDSIMHYGAYSFNVADKPTLVPRIEFFTPILGQRKTFSPLDAERINKLYYCDNPLRKTFNCNFNVFNICGFVNEKLGVDKWTHYDVESKSVIGQIDSIVPPVGVPLIDASQDVIDSGRYLYTQGNSSLVSRVYNHYASEDQCVVMWTNFDQGKIDVEFWSATDDYGELDKLQDSFTIEAGDKKWRYNQYNYQPEQSKFKVRITYSGEGIAAIDDFSIQEAPCRPHWFTIENVQQKIDVAKVAVDAAEQAANGKEIDYLDIEENSYWSDVMYAKSGHAFKIRWVWISNPRPTDYGQTYSSAYLYLSNASNDNEELFWPFMDQFFKIYARDQNPNVLERMDNQWSYVSRTQDEPEGNWEKPVDETSPKGYGRRNFISHFDLFTNQHGYYTKHDTLIIQTQVEDMRKTDKSTPLDDCEPCYGSGRACRMNPSGGSYCGCMAPLEQDANGQCDCAPGYVYFPNNPLREVCVDVCELDFCSAGERCIHAEGGVICDNGENSDAISAILSAFVLGISLLLL